MAWLSPNDVEGRIQHALRVERVLVNLGWFVAVVGVVAVLATLGTALWGETSWSRALVAAFGILAATVLSGAAAYGSGTNIGLAAVRLKRDVDKS